MGHVANKNVPGCCTSPFSVGQEFSLRIKNQETNDTTSQFKRKMFKLAVSFFDVFREILYMVLFEVHHDEGIFSTEIASNSVFEYQCQ